MKKIAGVSTNNTKLHVSDGQAYSNDLNEFYSRFDTNSTPGLNLDFKNDYLSDFPDELPVFEIDDTRKTFRSLKVNKSGGPDKISTNILKTCAAQLAVPFTHIFNQSIKQHKIPLIWKTSEIIPVPKRKVNVLNDLRPIALTSVLIKCLEKLFFSLLLPAISPFQDPNQFAYKCKRSVDDAIALFVDNIYKHVDTPKQFVRVLFVNFSSAFNTIQPKLLVEKLVSFKVNKHVCAWIFEFLTERPQFVRLKLQNNVFYSDSRVLNVGAPQGTCVSPALFTIYTDSCRSQSENVHIIKFADDTAIQGLIKEDNDLSDYIREIDSFCTSCKEHSLQLNISKTKELIIDFRKEGGAHESIVIDGQNVEQVQSYKYLGLTIDDSLDWHIQTSNVISKINQRMFFIRKLNAFRIDKYLISLFYRSVI